MNGVTKVRGMTRPANYAIALTVKPLTSEIDGFLIFQFQKMEYFMRTLLVLGLSARRTLLATVIIQRIA